MSTQSSVTTDHAVIREWVEARGGEPTVVVGTNKNDAGLLRIDFPGYSGKDSLEPIDWEEFFQIFEEKELAFLYQEELKSGEESRFCKFVNRESKVKD